MPAKIFISYRRDDDPSAAARVHDGLAQTFGHTNLFIDVDNLLAGQRFDDELAKALAACDVLIAIIGPRWMELLKAKSVSGERDYVREEIAGALQRKIIVVPVLVGRESQFPSLPRAKDLPKDIRELVRRQKYDVAYERFSRDIAGLSDAIMRVRRPRFALSRVAWRWIGATAIGVLAIGYVAAHSVGVPVPWPWWDEKDALVKGLQDIWRETDSQADQGRMDSFQRTLWPWWDPTSQVKSGSAERFRDLLANGQPCAFCPEMVVVPAGSFTMGSPQSEPDRDSGETQAKVTIAQPFAVAKFAVTFEEWDACLAAGGCNGYRPHDEGWGRGKQPVINVNLEDAKAYAAWLSRQTGKTYRLLSAAEREYVTRAGTRTTFWWGNEITPKQANYVDRHSTRTATVDSFEPNFWGLYNVHGNVWEWTEDCWNDSNEGNPGDGSARSDSNCSSREVRGGAWDSPPASLRSANRAKMQVDQQRNSLSFRVRRTVQSGEELFEEYVSRRKSSTPQKE
jgi:formylglycine-generating enzyme required for sulfatase activity